MTWMGTGSATVKLLAPAIPAIAVYGITEWMGTSSLVLSMGLYLTLLSALLTGSLRVLKTGLLVTATLSAAVLSVENPMVGAAAIAATALALLRRFAGIGPLALARMAAGAISGLMGREEAVTPSGGKDLWTDGGLNYVHSRTDAIEGPRDRILRVLRERGSVTKSELARVAGLSLPTVRKWVRELEEEGLVAEELVSLNGRRARLVAYLGP